MSDASPKVSVIIPVYNTAGHLARCLGSVCSQTLRDIEIICVDDGSTDSSAALLREWQARDGRVRLVETGKNRGSAAARNAGMAVARGEFLGFVDSDDYIDPDYYEKLTNAAEASSAEIARAAFLHIPPQLAAATRGDILEKNKELIDFEKLRNQLFKSNKFLFCNGFTTCIMKRDIVVRHGIRFPENTHNMEDITFLIQVVYHANAIASVDDTYYSYYLRENSNSRNSDIWKKFQNVFKSSLIIMDFLNSHTYNEYAYKYIFKFILDALLSLRAKAAPDPRIDARILEVIDLNTVATKKELWGFVTRLMRQNLHTTREPSIN